MKRGEKRVREGIKEVWLFERESVASFIVMGVFEGKERRGGHSE